MVTKEFLPELDFKVFIVGVLVRLVFADIGVVLGFAYLHFSKLFKTEGSLIK